MSMGGGTEVVTEWRIAGMLSRAPPPFPRVVAPLARCSPARAPVEAIGGAGFELLVPRTRTVWQVDARPVAGMDTRAPIVIAALLASVLLAPVVPPEGGAIFGVKGARLRLEAMGWASRIG